MTDFTRSAWMVLALAFAALASCKSSPNTGHGNPGAGGSAGDAGSGAVSGDSGQSTGGSAGTGNPVAEIKTCTELGERVCTGFAQCAPFLLDAYYGSADACRSVFTRNCEQLELDGTPLDRASCAGSLSSCGEYVAARGAPPACWAPKGIVPLDGACTADRDCAEGVCQREKGAAQGACVTPGSEGDSCAAPSRCAPNLRCNPIDSLCVRPVAEGQPCASPFECELGSTCDTAGVCARTSVGSACVDNVAPCNVGRGQWCLLEQCREMSFASDSNTCMNSGVECAGLDRCVVRQVEPLRREGVCQATAALDAACSVDVPCVEPLSCRGGKCRP